MQVEVDGFIPVEAVAVQVVDTWLDSGTTPPLQQSQTFSGSDMDTGVMPVVYNLSWLSGWWDRVHPVGAHHILVQFIDRNDQVIGQTEQDLTVVSQGELVVTVPANQPLMTTLGSALPVDWGYPVRFIANISATSENFFYSVSAWGDTDSDALQFASDWVSGQHLANETFTGSLQTSGVAPEGAHTLTISASPTQVRDTHQVIVPFQTYKGARLLPPKLSHSLTMTPGHHAIVMSPVSIHDYTNGIPVGVMATRDATNVTLLLDAAQCTSYGWSGLTWDSRWGGSSPDMSGTVSGKVGYTPARWVCNVPWSTPTGIYPITTVVAYGSGATYSQTFPVAVLRQVVPLGNVTSSTCPFPITQPWHPWDATQDGLVTVHGYHTFTGRAGETVAISVTDLPHAGKLILFKDSAPNEDLAASLYTSTSTGASLTITLPETTRYTLAVASQGCYFIPDWYIANGVTYHITTTGITNPEISLAISPEYTCLKYGQNGVYQGYALFTALTAEGPTQAVTWTLSQGDPGTLQPNLVGGGTYYTLPAQLPSGALGRRVLTATSTEDPTKVAHAIIDVVQCDQYIDSPI